MKRYKIVRIDEADYGCEGRPDGEEAMDSVWLEDENGERQIVRASDRSFMTAIWMRAVS